VYFLLGEAEMLQETKVSTVTAVVVFPSADIHPIQEVQTLQKGGRHQQRSGFEQKNTGQQEKTTHTQHIYI